jgi:hypothetical protein
MSGLDCSIRQYISKIGSFPVLWLKTGLDLLRWGRLAQLLVTRRIKEAFLCGTVKWQFKIDPVLMLKGIFFHDMFTFLAF